MTCDHEGDCFGWIELHEYPDGKFAAFMYFRDLNADPRDEKSVAGPLIFEHPDPRKAADTAGWELGEWVMERKFEEAP